MYKLKEARNRQKTIEFEYVNYGRTEVKQKVINVYSIILRGRKLFIIGFDTIKKEVRHYVFNQIKSVGEIYEDSSFELPPKEELSKFYRDSLVSFEGPEPRRVVIRFEKAAEIYVKQDFFHQSQRFYDKNSSLYLEMYINNEYELFTMLGKYLDSSELIEPADWKEEYIKKLKTALFLNKI